jgi:oligoendopeptidase F
MKRLLLAVLFILLLLASCSVPEIAQAQPEPPRERRVIHYRDMVYQRPDIEGAIAAIHSLTEQLRQTEDFEAVLQMTRQIQDMTDGIDTMCALAFLRSNIDMNDAFYDAEYRYISEASVDYNLAYSFFLRVLLESGFADAYRAHVGEYFFDYTQRRLLYECESVAEYKKELNDLSIDYEMYRFTLTVNDNGQAFTLNEIYLDLFNQWTYARGVRLLEQYYEEHAPVFADLYARIIELNKLIADTLGYASAADMIYSLYYNRDYSPAEAMEIFDGVKTHIVPLIPMLNEHISKTNALNVHSLDTLMSAIPNVLSSMDAELSEAWDFMVTYGLHDLEPSPDKTQGGFMVNLRRFDAPFIYGHWNGSFYCLQTVLHEFGHFFDYYLRNMRDEYFVNDGDTQEFYADGMFILMQDYFGAFTDDAQTAQLRMLAYVLNTIVDQSFYEEFQLRAFEADTHDAEALGVLFREVQRDYGFSLNSFTPIVADNPCHDWLIVPHFFKVPFYTASYVTGAMAAMQLWDLHATDRDAAVEAYLNMIRQDQNQYFGELLESVSLRPINDPNMLADIAEQVTQFLDLL